MHPKYLSLIIALALVSNACEADPPLLGRIRTEEGRDLLPCELAGIVEYLSAERSTEELIADGVTPAAAHALTDAIASSWGIQSIDDVLIQSDLRTVRALAEALDGSTCRADIPTNCPDAPVLGEAGATAVDTVSLDSVASPLIYQVPEDLEGLTISAHTRDGEESAFLRVRLNEVVLYDSLNDLGRAPFFLVGSTLAFPSDETSGLSEGCLEVTPDPGASVLRLASRRRAPGGTLDINAIMVGDPGYSEAEIREALAGASQIFERQGPMRFGTIEFFHADGVWSSVYPDEFDAWEVARRFVSPDPMRLNLLFLAAAPVFSCECAGQSPIPAPVGAVGVVDGAAWSAVDSLVIAHEVGHALGLQHSSDVRLPGEFEHDALEDTPECGFEVDGCDNLMQAAIPTLGDSLTPAQLDVILRSPYLR